MATKNRRSKAGRRRSEIRSLILNPFSTASTKFQKSIPKRDSGFSENYTQGSGTNFSS